MSAVAVADEQAVGGRSVVQPFALRSPSRDPVEFLRSAGRSLKFVTRKKVQNSTATFADKINWNLLVCVGFPDRPVGQVQMAIIINNCTITLIEIPSSRTHSY